MFVYRIDAYQLRFLEQSVESDLYQSRGGAKREKL